MTREEALKLIKTELCPIRCEGENNMDECEARCEFKEAIKIIGQEPKTGHWIFCENLTTYWKEVYKCSECNEEITKTGCWNHHSELEKYCPNCGAKMEVKE